MPHIIVEYSANIEDEIGIDALFETLTEVAVGTGVFELSGIRVRGERRDRYRISDNDPSNGFAHTILRVGSGRTEETLKKAGETIYTAICAHLQKMYETRALNISMEIQEIHPVLTFKKNNIGAHMKARAAAQSAAEAAE